MLKLQLSSLLLTAALAVPNAAMAAATAPSDEEVTPITQTGYIKDTLFVYIHAGAGKRFRILGSINAGTSLELLETDDETGFIKIKDDKGRSGWIEAANYTTEPSMRSKYEALVLQFNQLSAENQDNQTARDNALIELDSARQDSNDFGKTLATAEEEKLALQAQIDRLEGEKTQKTLLYGAGILFGGVLFGLIAPSLIPRRRRQERWV